MTEQTLSPFGGLRRRDRLINSAQELEEILVRGTVMYLGLCDGKQPFVVPVFYVYDGGSLYYHSAEEGTKMTLMRQNPRVCFVVSLDQGVIEDRRACDYEAKHRTAIGFGTVSELMGETEKRRVLELLVHKLAQKTLPLQQERVLHTAVCRIQIESVTGKSFGF